MACTKRDTFVKALQEVITSLESEQNGLIAKTPLIRKSIEEAIEAIRLFLADCEGTPRIAVVGVTGVGKSTFINHVFGQEVAKVNDIQAETLGITTYGFPPPNGGYFEIADTRGLGEIGRSVEAKDQLITDILNNRPHLVAYLVDAGRRDAIDSELKFLIELSQKCSRQFMREPKFVFVLNKCDTMTPSGFARLPQHPWQHRTAEEKPEVPLKRKNIFQRLEWFSEQLKIAELPDSAFVIPTALEWGVESQRVWNKEELMAMLHRQASPGLLLGFGETPFLEDRLENIAMEVVWRFSELASAIGLTPLPIADFVVLLPLQFAMMRVISSFGNKGTLTPAALFELVGLAGQGGKLLAGQFAKLLPGVGDFINAGIAGSFTLGLGKIAIDHFIHGKHPNLKILNLINIGKSLKEDRK